MPAHDWIDRLSQGARGFLVVALVAAAAALAGLFSIPTLDRDEGRYAQATAQMLESGDFVRIQYLDGERNKKPAGAHWLQALSVSTLSRVEAREIWAYRIPSLFGAMLAAAATFWAGIAAVGRRAAFTGALLFAASALLSTEGQIAKTDALLCGFCALALAGLARLRLGFGSPRANAIILWVAVACASMIKGPVGPMVVALAIGALALWERRIAWLKPLLFWPGPALAAAIALPWWVAIGVVTDGRFYADALLGDAAGKLAGGGEHPALPPGLHTLLLPILIFPASLGLVSGAALSLRAIRAPRADEASVGLRLLLAWALPTFLLFELSPTKLVHYPLPAYPAIALLAGAGLVGRNGSGVGRANLALFAFGAAGLAAAAVALAQDQAVVGVIAAALILGGVAGLARARTLAAHGAIAVAAGLIFAWGAREAIAPRAEAWFATRAVTRSIDASELGRGERGALLVGYAEPSLVFALDGRARPLSPEAAAEAAQAGDVAIVSEDRRNAFEVGLKARGLAFEAVGAPAEARHYNNGGKRLRLQPGRVRPSD